MIGNHQPRHIIAHGKRLTLHYKKEPFDDVNNVLPVLDPMKYEYHMLNTGRNRVRKYGCQNFKL